VSTTKENSEAFLLPGKELGLEVNATKTTDQRMPLRTLQGNETA